MKTRYLYGFMLMATLLTMAKGSPVLSTASPLGFFTNAANRLLLASTANWRAESFNNFTNTFGATTTNAFGVGNIPVYVNGQFVYTPAVNRILQLAANVYDATTNSPYPSVFRPLFSKDAAGNICITSYTNVVPFTDGVNDLQLSAPFDVAVISALPGAFTNVADNIYGVPWIIGAKKGLPNFNEFSMENNLSVMRRLQFTRITNGSPIIAPIITGTNQMYLMSLSSSMGVELWNSYASNYPGTIVVGVNENASMTITNDDPGFDADAHVIEPMTFSTNVSFIINSWPGVAYWRAGSPNADSFVLPLNVNFIMLTNAVYRSPYASGAITSGLTAPCLIPTNYFTYLGIPLLFETNSPNGFHLPQFGLLLTNRLQVFMLDYDTNDVYRVIDYVHFAGPNSSLNVNSNLADGDTMGGNFGTGVWNTNYTIGTSAPTGPTYGIVNQIAISKSGSPPAEDGQWSSDFGTIPLGGTLAQQQAYFQAFFLPVNKTTTIPSVTNLLLTMQAPYSPVRNIVQYITWQANDPLVHYLASDIDSPISNSAIVPQPGVNHYNNAGSTISPLTSLNLGQLNDNYMPWGGNPHLAAEGQGLWIDTNAYNPAERDPLMTQSDNWDFPTNPFSTFNWLGRIHRGTPWQTVFLKSMNILANNNSATWQTWSGNNNSFDAANSAPVQDWHLAALLADLLSTNPVEQLVSVNNPDTNVWLNVLNGLTAWTNSSSGIFIPVIIASNSPPAAIIVAGISATRASQNVSGAFPNVGDILATAQLSDQSPFLNLSDPAQQSGISDEAYEIIPSQLLSLLRVDSIGSTTIIGGQLVVQFSGDDGHAYAIQASSNLIDWASVGTNCPINGTFSFTNSAASNASPQFYRSVLLP